LPQNCHSDDRREEESGAVLPRVRQNPHPRPFAEFILREVEGLRVTCCCLLLVQSPPLRKWGYRLEADRRGLPFGQYCFPLSQRGIKGDFRTPIVPKTGDLGLPAERRESLSYRSYRYLTPTR